MNKVWYIKKHYNLTHDDLINPCMALDDDLQVYSVNFKKIDLKTYRPKNCFVVIYFDGGKSKKTISLERINE